MNRFIPITPESASRLSAAVLVSLFLLVLCSPVLATDSSRLEGVDLPACEASAPGMAQGVSMGIVQPHASEHVLNYAARLTLKQADFNVCSETWRSVLPRWLPWARQLERGHGLMVFGLGFVLAVTLLWHLSPRAWWRRTTLLGLLGLGCTTYLLGLALLTIFHLTGGQRMLFGTVVSLHLSQQAEPVWLDVAGARELEARLVEYGVLPTAKPVVDGFSAHMDSQPVVAVLAPHPAGIYWVHHRLNLRELPGVQSRWLATLPRGELVAFDGAVEGDWWRIRSHSGQVGWASSLWLRRPDELPVQQAGPAANR